jgi:hypothetical protein
VDVAAEFPEEVLAVWADGVAVTAIGLLDVAVVPLVAAGAVAGGFWTRPSVKVS